MERIIMHVDVNNAFLSWSAVYYLQNGLNVDIRTIPSAIAGEKAKRTGIILAKSIPAKKMGVKTGDAIYLAKNKCPSLKIYPPNYKFYSEMSKKMFDYLYSLTPDIEIASIDECYIDYSKIKKLYGDEINFAKKINKEIKEKFGFTVNVGIANNKLCAKMASDFEKPNKVHTLYKNEIKEKMWPLDVDELFMVGKSSSTKLHELGINKIGDLACSNLNMLVKYFKSMGHMMYEYANGIDNSDVEKAEPKNKGISNSTTLPYDLYDLQSIKKVFRKLSQTVGIRLREEKKYATVVSVQLKNNNFFNYQHQKKLVNPVSSNEDIYEVSCEILKDMWKEDSIRLVGLRVSDFIDKTFEQVSLFEETGKSNKREKIQNVIDKINKKYGNNTINNASLYNDK